jgi:hypothetical protein
MITMQHVEFRVVLSSIKLNNGEEILANVIYQKEQKFTLPDIDFDKYFYLIAPAKMREKENLLDNTSTIQLTAWSQFSGIAVHPIPKSNVVVTVPILASSEYIYNEWFTSTFKLELAPTIKFVVRNYFNKHESLELNQSRYLQPHVYSVDMFSTLATEEEKRFMFTTILNTFQPTTVQ